MTTDLSIDAERVALSGRKRAGKDYVAEHNGYVKYGFADPMYRLAEHFLGSSDKSVPGVRNFLRTIGAWGRGMVSDRYPLTAERNRTTKTIRSHGARITDMGEESDWFGFGRAEDFWIDMLISRLEGETRPVATTNARFPNEVNRLVKEAGYEHRHVLCSTDTRKERIQGAGEEPDPDVPPTERFAYELDLLAGLKDPQTETEILPPGGGFEMADELEIDLFANVENGRSVIWNDYREPEDYVAVTSHTDSKTSYA
jgi:hypothetical protein